MCAQLFFAFVVCKIVYGFGLMASVMTKIDLIETFSVLMDVFSDVLPFEKLCTSCSFARHFHDPLVKLQSKNLVANQMIFESINKF